MQVPLETYPAAVRDALAPLVRASRERPADAAAAGDLARYLHAWEQWDHAHAAYTRAAALAPGDFRWVYLDACVLQRLARHAEAADRLRQALAIDATYLAARVKLPEALLEAGQPSASRPLFEALAREPQAEASARFGLGRIAAAEGRHADAVASFDRALALFPEWGAAHYARGLSLRALGRRDEAAQALARHAQYGARWPAVPDPLLAATVAVRDDAVRVLRRAEALALDGDVAGAAAANEAALERDPSLTLAHERLVGLYGRLGAWEKAEAHYRAALAAGGDAPDLQYDYGHLQGLQGHWEEAERAYRRAIAANPSHARAHNNLGQVLERRQDFDGALAEYRLAMASEPTFRLARFNAARALLALGRPEAAVEELTKIVEPRDAEAPKYLFGLAVAEIRLGRVEEGRRQAGEARALAAQFGQADLAAAIDAELQRLPRGPRE